MKTVFIFTKTKKAEWTERARGAEKLTHLDKGDILIKKNFDFDLVSSVISLGQRIGQYFNTEGTGEGDWSSGHVALALDQLRLAEQTGEGLSINTFGVTSKELAPHEVSLVYYDVWDCRDSNVKKNSAEFESLRGGGGYGRLKLMYVNLYLPRVCMHQQISQYIPNISLLNMSHLFLRS